ncbi:MAG: polymer-forming cytoskeletal protein [Clostridium sp.]|jgi:cytoskeletal protein CcmA (bactofilin family)|nr:polymer-forming cytoskeletal protein [Clostridium sp.]
MKAKKETGNVKINTILGRDSEFQGDFLAKGSVRIDGSVNGNVKITGTLIVGANGWINGDVESDTAIVGGEIFGNITAREKVELTSTAKAIGNITTKVIVIDQNAIFQGKCDMNQEIPEGNKKRTLTAKTLRMGRKSEDAAIQAVLRQAKEEEQRAFPGTGSEIRAACADPVGLAE